MESLIYFKYITNEPVARHSCAGGNPKFRVAAVIFVCTGTTDKPGPSEKYFSDGPARTNRSYRSPAVQPALPCSAQPCKPRYNPSASTPCPNARCETVFPHRICCPGPVNGFTVKRPSEKCFSDGLLIFIPLTSHPTHQCPVNPSLVSACRR